jgi:hypothetical protein
MSAPLCRQKGGAIYTKDILHSKNKAGNWGICRQWIDIDAGHMEAICKYRD